MIYSQRDLISPLRFKSNVSNYLQTEDHIHDSKMTLQSIDQTRSTPLLKFVMKKGVIPSDHYKDLQNKLIGSAQVNGR